MAVLEQQAIQLDFFEYLFGQDEGYVCIGTIPRPYKRDEYDEKFFEWPAQADKMLNHIERASINANVYYGINLLSIPKRKKENCIEQNLVWADLDTCRPDRLEIPPQCVVESSPAHYHAVWRLDTKIDPRIAEDYSKRIAYAYANIGVDKSGYDLTQLLRVPGTYNFKYELTEVPQVKLITRFPQLLPQDVFAALDPVDDVPLEDWTGLPAPEVGDLPDPIAVAYAYQDALRRTAFARYYGEEPHSDWSKALWRLINTCFEVGMSREETFAIARAAKCNKYARDNRPESHLWREILKAELQYKKLRDVINDNRSLVMPQLLTADEIRECGDTIIDDYRSWAETATDAVPEFHELACAILLSALMSAGLRIPLDWSSTGMNTNLWGLILGDSTLTRKTTSMSMAMDFLAEIDRELIVASDGSAEGLLTALSLRPKMVSVFYRDEITGFLDAIHKKEYLSSMPEILTHLYDVPKYYPRRLRKETIVVQEPIFIFFGGGIKDRSYSLIAEEMYISGFMPRFLVVTGNTDLTRIRRTGPPIATNHDRRDDLRTRFAALYQTYSLAEMQIQIGDPNDPQMVTLNRTVNVHLTDDAWKRAGDIEGAMMAAAQDCPEAARAMPSFQRMYFSMLKLAALLCASRKEPGEDAVLQVEMIDVLNATYFIQRWGMHFVELVKNSGHTRDEVTLQAVYRSIERHPGILRGEVMQRHKLNARVITEVEDTLEQRMMIQVDRKGKGSKYYPIGR